MQKFNNLGVRSLECVIKITFFLFYNQNICCEYSKEPFPLDGSFEHPKQMLKLINKNKL